MLAIKLILGIFAIPIPGFGISLSFAWLPIYIIGWFFGPVVGLFFGALADTLSWVISGSVWFWMYSIQEPIVGLISGIFGWTYMWHKNKSIKWQIIIQKIFIITFLLFITITIFVQFKNIENNQFAESKSFMNETIYIICLSVFLLLFFVLNEVQNWLMWKKHRQSQQKSNYTVYLFVSVLVIFMISLFSFILGPITQVKYFEFLNNHPPSKYLKYGAMYYLLPRVLKESIKTPIYILLAFSIIVAIKYQFNYNINSIKTRW